MEFQFTGIKINNSFKYNAIHCSLNSLQVYSYLGKTRRQVAFYIFPKRAKVVINPPLSNQCSN